MQSLTELAGSVGRRLRGTENRTDADGDGDGDGGRGRDGTAGPSSGTRSSLFRCPGCETVYVAVDKDTCSTCESAVEPVPSTQSEAG
ncbi:hypothetical protein [Halosimplex salinum]|uniref:hypothetical protein n=1 Tax=Halosimplex salinum TaxID=1710538 RepID=UPI000F496040|nr:hypothetical protein [Halosimplex salinum]